MQQVKAIRAVARLVFDVSPRALPESIFAPNPVACSGDSSRFSK